MTEFRNKTVWVIRNSDLDIVCDLVLGYRCFLSVTKFSYHSAHNSIQ
jgi:hypothetical protein